MENHKTKSDLLEEFHQSHKTRKQDGGEKDRKEEIRATAREVFEFSLFPGVSNIVRSNWPVKLTWICSHLCLFGI